MMALSKCVVCSSKKLRFTNIQEAIRLLLLGPNSPLKHVLLLGISFDNIK